MSIRPATATIASGASLSDAVDIASGAQRSLLGIITPAGWTTAAITFQGSLSGDDNTWFDLVNAGGVEVQIAAVAASKWVPLDPADFASVPWLRVRSGTSGTPVNQTGGDALTLVTRSL